MEEYKGRAIICIRIGGGGRNPTLSRKNWPDGWRGSRFFPIVRFLDFLVDLGREESTDYFLSPLSLSLVRTTRSLSLSCSFARLLCLFLSFARSLFLSLVRTTHLLSLFLICSLASSFSVPHNSLARLLFLCPAQFACSLALSLSFRTTRLLSLFLVRSVFLSLVPSLARFFFLSRSHGSFALSFFLDRATRSCYLMFHCYPRKKSLGLRDL